MFRSILIVLCLGLLFLASPTPAQACDYGVGAIQQIQYQQRYSLGLGAGGCGYGAGALGFGGYDYRSAQLLRFGNGYVPPLGLGVGYGRQSAFVGYGAQLRLNVGYQQRQFIQPIRQKAIIRGY